MGNRLAMKGAGELIAVKECSEMVQMLVGKAKEAKERAYAGYTNFPVGSALLTQSGDVFIGCNVENASLGATVCAERVALFKMVSEGVHKWKEMAVITGLSDPCFSCGMCLQVMLEFAADDAIVYAANCDGTHIRKATLKELYPYSFTPEHMGQ